MKALFLIGGQATRLYPLSKQLAKSLMPICDRELLHYQVTQIARAGINGFILAAGHLVDQLAAFVASYAGGLEFVVSNEPEPLGTGGAIAHAKQLIGDEPVLVLNADILSSVNIKSLLDFHHKQGKAATLVGYKVSDPSNFGLLNISGDTITGFTEKPEGAALDSGQQFINAGMYVLSPEAVDSIATGRKVSIEREVFPKLIIDTGPLAHYPFEGLWADIGTFDTYHEANFNLLGRRFYDGEDGLWGERNDVAIFKDLIYVNKSSELGKNVDLFHRVILMRETKVGANSKLRNALVLPGATVGEGSTLEDCIIGPDVEIPEASELKNVVQIKAEKPLPFYPQSTPLGTLLPGS